MGSFLIHFSTNKCYNEEKRGEFVKIGNEEFIKLLKVDVLKFWNKLAKGYRDNYLDYIGEAKRRDTREKRLIEVQLALEEECKTIYEYHKMKKQKKNDENMQTSHEKNQSYFSEIQNLDNAKIIKDLYYRILLDNPALEEHHAWNVPMFELFKI